MKGTRIMAKAKQQATVTATGALRPVMVKNHTEAADAAFDGVRRRPVIAIDETGKMVVCCRKTALKNGWKLEGSLHQRPRGKVRIGKAGKMEVVRPDVDVDDVLAPRAAAPAPAAGRRVSDTLAASALIEQAVKVLAPQAHGGKRERIS